MSQPDVPAWCREEAAWLVVCCDGKTPGIAYLSRESAEEHMGPGETIHPLYSATALHAAYLRGLEAAAGVCEAEGHKWRDDAGRPAPGPMLCAAAIRARARG